MDFLSIHSFIHFQYLLYLGQGHGRSGAYPDLGRWEEIEKKRGNPCRHKANIETFTRMVIQAQWWKAWSCEAATFSTLPWCYPFLNFKLLNNLLFVHSIINKKYLHEWVDQFIDAQKHINTVNSLLLFFIPYEFTIDPRPYFIWYKFTTF